MIGNEYDVFIAFYNNKTGGSKDEAKQIYDYLTEKNIHCYLYSESGDKDFKANFVRIMQSKLFLFVYSDGLKRDLLRNGEIDKSKNYHLYVEMDCFMALTQTRAYGHVPSDAAIVYFANENAVESGSAPRPPYLHPLFTGRDSSMTVCTYSDFKEIYEWVKKRKSEFGDDEISKEVLMVLNDRRNDLLDSQFSGINFQEIMQNVSSLKCVGISNWAFTVSDGCKKLINVLSDNAAVEMLFLDPSGKNARMRSSEERLDISVQIQTAFNTIRSSFGLQGRSKLLKKLALYTYDIPPRENMIFIYTKTKGNYALIQHYSYNRPGAFSPCMVLKQSSSKTKSDSVFSYYEALYEEIKRKSKPINLFCKRKNWIHLKIAKKKEIYD